MPLKTTCLCPATRHNVPPSAAGYIDDIYEDIPPPRSIWILVECQMANLNLAVIEGLDK